MLLFLKEILIPLAIKSNAIIIATADNKCSMASSLSKVMEKYANIPLEKMEF